MPFPIYYKMATVFGAGWTFEVFGEVGAEGARHFSVHVSLNQANQYYRTNASTD